MNGHIVKKQDRWQELEHDWIRLQNLISPCPFRSWWFFEQSIELWDEIWVYRQEGKICAIFPMQKKHWWSWTTMGVRDFNYACFVVDPAHIESAMYAFIKFLKATRRMLFIKGLRGWIETDQLIAEQFRKSRLLTAHYAVPAFEVELSTLPESYYQKHSKHHSLKKRMRKLSQRGPIEWKQLSIDQFDELLKLHYLRWSERRDTSGIKEEEKQTWLKNLWLNRPDEVQVLGFECAGELVAFQWDFLSGDRVVSYWTGFHPGYSAYAPGFLMLFHTINHWHTQGTDRFDFSSGYEKYKEEWSTHQRLDQHLVIAPWSLTWAFAGTYLKHRIISKLKHYPQVVQAIRERRLYGKPFSHFFRR